jgi:hypothetical protein
VKNLQRNLVRNECPRDLYDLLSKLETISTTTSATNDALAVAMLAPFPHVLSGMICYREGPSQYGHVIGDAALVCEGSFKSLYPLVLNKALPSKPVVENVAKEFENQTTFNDIRVRKILPTSWVNIYSIRNRKSAAHYGPISEQTDALYALIGAIYVCVNHIEFVASALSDSSLQSQLSLNSEAIFLQSMNQIVLNPIIPTTVIQFTSDGPVISTKQSLSQQEAIVLILYALPFTSQEYSSELLDKLLRLSGYPVKSLSKQLSILAEKGRIARLPNTLCLSTQGIAWAQEIIDRIHSSA